MKPIICIALLVIPAAHAQPGPFSLKNATSGPPRVRTVDVKPQTEKIYVSAKVDPVKPVQVAKSAAARTKAARPHPVPKDQWNVTPKFEKGGKADPTFGFMLNHRF